MAWYTLFAHAQIFPKSRGTETDMSIYYPKKSTTAMATAQVTEDRLFTDALSYTLSRAGLSSIALKQEQLTAICYLYQRKDLFLWLPTGFGKSVCYKVLPFLFDFAGSKSGSMVL